MDWPKKICNGKKLNKHYLCGHSVQPPRTTKVECTAEQRWHKARAYAESKELQIWVDTYRPVPRRLWPPSTCKHYTQLQRSAVLVEKLTDTIENSGQAFPGTRPVGVESLKSCRKFALSITPRSELVGSVTFFIAVISCNCLAMQQTFMTSYSWIEPKSYCRKMLVGTFSSKRTATRSFHFFVRRKTSWLWWNRPRTSSNSDPKSRKQATARTTWKRSSPG